MWQFASRLCIMPRHNQQTHTSTHKHAKHHINNEANTKNNKEIAIIQKQLGNNLIQQHKPRRKKAATMASRVLAPVLRRSLAVSRAGTRGLASGATPPLAPFARIPAPTEKLVENHDCLFDDACAPELALDFDCQNVSTGEAVASWLGAFGVFAALFVTIKYVGDPIGTNPAISRGESGHVVYPDPQHD
mmetsp:Transcript_2730/g.7591  ORF Transcript_2730/g.7591 Transcript_2730/m.7591 type:complete len:189 (+) Transcript_2730:38-604(+)